MGLLLRPDAYYAKSPQGAYVLTHEGEIRFTGKSVYLLIDRLAPYLDGRHGLADLTADLAPERRRLVERMVATLREHGAVREVRGPGPAASAPASPEAAFLDYFREDGADAFAAYATKRALVVGSGLLLVETAVAAARSGLGRVEAVVAGGSRADADELSSRLADAGGAASAGTTAAFPERPDEAALASRLDGADLVVHAAEDGEAADRRAGLLEHLCAESGIPLAQAFLRDGAVWLAPIGSSWTSGRLRRAARTLERGAPAPGPEGATDALTATAAAAQLVHGAFRAVTGAGAGEPNTLTRVGPSGLESTTHRFRPHPFAAPAPPADTERAFLDRVAALAERPRLAPGDFSREARSCTGEALGALGEPDEGDRVQFPLHVCGVDVSDPVGLLGARDRGPTVVGSGTGFETARLRAALRAFALYGTLMADPRRLLSPEGSPLCAGDGDPRAAVAALRTHRAAGRVWAYGLVDGSASLVDAARVFSALGRGASPPPMQADDTASSLPPGTAAAYSWSEAVEAGLLAQCHRRTLADIAGSAAPFPRLDPAAADLDEGGDYCRALLGAVDDAVACHDVTGPLGVPTVVCLLGGAPAASASGLTIADALGSALEKTLLAYQARRNGRCEYAPAVPHLPARLRCDSTRPAAPGPRLSGADLAAALAERGHWPAAVPLDHDAEVNRVMPFTVRVVLDDDQ
ncbi:hypothetical protein LP52_15660 [Streptomonospora alba]|uniref:YcaO domain-containing protein n=1 Tax=Streptomonospora alba TaxID=183763 RepID=A0A0C2FFT4_9ACTN|nr:hypothetical protein [Streptomonospora alba]KIH98114.1 hypothetical protein LP52_15660 [Streptomonospora alba]